MEEGGETWRVPEFCRCAGGERYIRSTREYERGGCKVGGFKGSRLGQVPDQSGRRKRNPVNGLGNGGTCVPAVVYKEPPQKVFTYLGGQHALGGKRAEAEGRFEVRKRSNTRSFLFSERTANCTGR